MLLYRKIQKITIFSRTAKLIFTGSLKFSRYGFCKAMRKKQRQEKMDGTCYSNVASCEEFANSNNKERIKWVIFGATVFLLFWLHLESKSFRTARKFYMPQPALLLLIKYKQNLKLLIILPLAVFLLFINNYCIPANIIS